MARILGLSQIRTLFNIGKKFVDILDDLWNTLRGILPGETIRVFTPFILGIVGFITHLGEGIQGAREAYAAYKNEKIGQRKTRIVSSVLIFMFSGAGLGLAASLIAAAAGAAVTGVTLALAPVLIPGFLTAIYSLALWRKAYVFHRTKEKEAKAKGEYEKASAQLTADNPALRAELEVKKKKWEALREKCLRAERDLAFNVVEVVTSALVVTATILGSAAIIGASVASLGALPIVMLLVGVIGGVACKLLEYYDEKKGFHYSRGLRNWFAGKEEALNNTPSLALRPSLTPEAPTQKFECQGPKTQNAATMYKKMIKENLIELTSLKKQENFKSLVPETKGEPVRPIISKRKRQESLDTLELLGSLAKRLKV